MLTAWVLAIGLAPSRVVAREPGAELVDPDAAFADLPAVPSVTAGALGAIANPAAWALGGGVGEAAVYWDERGADGGSRDWGFAWGQGLGLAMDRRTVLLDGTRRGHVLDWQLGAAVGDRATAVGLAYRWAAGDDRSLGRERALALGSIHRPNRWLSTGATAVFSIESSARTGAVDVGVRPLGTPLVTLFGAGTLSRGERLEDARWTVGAEIQPTRGLQLGAKLMDGPVDGDASVSVNLGLTLDGFGVHALPRYDDDGDRLRTRYVFRDRPPHPGMPLARTVRAVIPERRYVPVSLENRVLTYQPYQWFDARRVGLVDLIAELDAIADEPGARGVVLNLAGFRTRAALAWELREKLLELRRRGKEVIVHADRLGMIGYYVASAADRISLDPEGHLRLTGFAAYRTYLKGALDKIGVGFEEFRFFTHKSASETYSRSDMSDVDREQLGRHVDVVYETVRDGIVAGRGLTPGAFDRIVDDEAVLTADVALERGLVDVLGRYDDLARWIAADRDGARIAGRPDDRSRRSLPNIRWGPRPEIALVYARGACAMDTGIRGRATSAFLRRAASRRSVAAVVLRADSPGGDPLPSDLVAEGLRKVGERGKPCVVSQGSVAASGGYWISAPGDPILTTPFTVTGSIGVIGGWAYDDGLGEKLGVSADGVQRGRHADLATGIRFPYVPLPLPTRPMDDAERAIVRDRFMRLYDRFVANVAETRGLREADVRAAGEGRVWMGGDAIDRGLCDRFGTLESAVDEAIAGAGLDRERDDVRVVEYPPRRLFEWPSLVPTLPLPIRLAAALPWPLREASRALGATRGDLPDPLPGGDLRPGLAGVDSPSDLGPAPPSAAPAAASVAPAGPVDWSALGLGPGVLTYLEAVLRASGRPLLMTPPEYLGPGVGEESE